MRIRMFALVMAFSLVVAIAAQAQQPTGQALKVTLIAKNVYRVANLSPGGSNVVALITGDGIVLVDAQERPDAQLIVSALKAVSDQPVRYVIETHCHIDHIAGNGEFHRQGAVIVAHVNVPKRLNARKCGNTESSLPTRTFENQLTLRIGNEEVNIYSLPTGHTDGDVMVHFKNANVAATGDSFVSTNLPAYSKYAGGSMLGVNEQLRRIVSLLPSDVTIVPGHGPQASMRDVRDALKVLDEMKEAISTGVAKGRSLDQLREDDILKPWKSYVNGSGGPDYLKSYYDCLTRPLDPAFQL